MTDLLILLLLIAGGLAYLCGLGWFIAGTMLSRLLNTEDNQITVLHFISLLIISGLIVNYGITLIVQSLVPGLIIGMIVSLAGWIFLYKFFSNKSPLKIRPLNISKWFAVILTSGLFIFPLIALPLDAWDARLIWFFHGKMIYFAQTIGQAAGWQHPFLTFSHPDYPILVPALSAQIATLLGYWNEYIPKIALLFLLFPAIGLLFDVAKPNASSVFLLLALPVSFHHFLWNGYMDAYLAIYFALSLLFLGIYIQSSKPVDLLTSFISLVLILNIKNEGALAVLSILGVMAAYSIFDKAKIENPERTYKKYKNLLLIAALAFLPFILWQIYLHFWHVPNDLQIGMASIPRIMARIKDGSFIVVLKNILDQTKISFGMLALIYFISMANKRSFPPEGLPPLLASLVYAAGMGFVYLQTPADVSWHLLTSVNRTMFTVNAGIIVAIFFALQEFEKSANPRLPL